MLPKFSSIVLMLTSLLAGCAVGPDYDQPDVNLPERYQGDKIMDQQAVKGNADLLAWWERFDDPQLTRFVTPAMDQNLDLVQATARVAQARARGAGHRLPHHRYALNP